MSFHVGNGGKAKFPATCDAREEVLPGGTSGLAFWPPEPWAKNVCCVSHPTCGCMCKCWLCLSTPAMGRKNLLAAGTKVPGSGVNMSSRQTREPWEHPEGPLEYKARAKHWSVWAARGSSSQPSMPSKSIDGSNPRPSKARCLFLL